MGTKLKDIASGGATAGATDKVVGVRSGTSDVLVTPVALDAAQTWTAAQIYSAALTFSSTVAASGAVTLTGGLTVTTAGLTITDVDIALSATTGTKIGTATSQKLGFFNATPVVQQTGTTELIACLTNLGLLATGAHPLTLTGLLTITDVNIALSVTTGTKLGTATGQKLGFWGATPVVQQVLATGASHTIDEVITFLQTIGLCKQS